MKTRKRKAVASKAVKKYVKKVLDDAREDKYIDLRQAIALDTAATDNVGSVVLLSGCSQGTTFATRIGEAIKAKSLEFRYDTAASDDTTDIVKFRVIVFQDRQIRTSTLPLVADVLEDVQYDSAINHVAVNAGRFKILHDNLHIMGPQITAGDKTLVYRRKKIKLNSKIVYSNSSTGTQKNNIFVLLLSNGTAASNNPMPPPFNMYSRVTFEDA